ncbi:MAG: ADP-glyceromanno-heptose 6-epimerase [Bdellovibrionaceae bacterium]|mgnify:CR=1 FL=1|nr:ADP-glyceromanno-heptose 6-epimerase [Pseudobdellovibrionaceae bacterium]
MDSKIIVTGANGFIGSVIVWELNKKGFTNIIAVDSVPLSERNLLKNLQFNQFLSHTELRPFLQKLGKGDVSWVIHMGACSSTTEKNWDFLYENNTLYTQKIFELAEEMGFDVIYASSAATYGAGENGFDDTTDANILKPLNLYGDSKVLFDRWVKTAQTLPKHWYGLKFFNVYGPMEYHKDSMASVVFKSFHSIKSTGKMKLFRSHNPDYKDGEQLRDFVYVKDVSRWIVELMEKKPENGIYNMGFGKARTWIDLVSSVFKSLNLPNQIDWMEVPADIRNQYQYFTEAKMNRWLAQKMSPPQWSIEDGVKDYVQNYLNTSDPYLNSKKGK